MLSLNLIDFESNSKKEKEKYQSIEKVCLYISIQISRELYYVFDPMDLFI